MNRESPDRADEVSTVLSTAHDLPPETLPSFVLTVVDGADCGLSLNVDGAQPSRAYVGKSPVCQLRLADVKVSRRHLALDVVGKTLRLTDLGSTNGTSVNGIAVADGFLRGGEVIRIGDTALRVDVAMPTTRTMSHASRFGRLVGASAEMRRLYPLCERLSVSNVPLVIEGETGTGKELLAESLHEASHRAAGPFVVFDCTAVPPNLVEAALFGHERGAFTGAVTTAKGVFEQADGGTLLIDEIGDLEHSLQPKLLRALERFEVRRVGGDRWIRVDVRVVAATRRDLEREIQEGRFRDDLFYRLAVARIELPPLRERHGDIALLAQHFWEHLGGGDTPLPFDLLLRFESYSWPGNVRELHNAVARRLALGDLAAEQGRRPVDVRSAAPEDVVEEVLRRGLPLSQSREIVVDNFERRYVQRVLSLHGNDVARAAAASGIARRYFQLLRARQQKPGA